MIASHYAEPLPVRLSAAAPLRAEADEGSEVLEQLTAGSELRILDRSRGWAWGYAGARVGYVPASAL